MPIIVLTKSHYPATITKEMRHKVYAEALAGIVDAVYEDERRGTQTAPTVCRAQSTASSRLSSPRSPPPAPIAAISP